MLKNLELCKKCLLKDFSAHECLSGRLPSEVTCRAYRTKDAFGISDANLSFLLKAMSERMIALSNDMETLSKLVFEEWHREDLDEETILFFDRLVNDLERMRDKLLALNDEMVSERNEFDHLEAN